MKQAFEVLKNRPRIQLVLTRDSVCAGDYCDAPHEKTVEVPSFLDPAVLACETSSGYLPSISGIGHSWTCLLNDIEIAQITSSGIQPLVMALKFTDQNRIHFVYKSANY